MNPQKIQGPGTTIKFLRVISSSKRHGVSEAVIDKLQTHSNSKNMKEVQAFGGILGFGRLLFSTCHSVSILYTFC